MDKAQAKGYDRMQTEEALTVLRQFAANPRDFVTEITSTRQFDKLVDAVKHILASPARYGLTGSSFDRWHRDGW
jgi:hypothetical protein